MRLYSNPLVFCRTSRTSTSYLNSMNFEEIYKRDKEIKEKNKKILLEKSLLIEEIEKLFFQCKNNKLLNIRRNLFNGLYNNAAKNLKYIEDYEVYIRIKELIAEVNELEESLLENKNLFYKNSLEIRKILRNAFINESDLSDSLIHFNMSIYNKLSKYIEKPVEEHNNDLRKLDYTLIKVLTRSTKKTSPFSTLTLVSRADENGVEEINDLIKSVEINHTIMLRGFFCAVLNNNESIKNLRYVLGNIRLEEGTIHIVGQKDNIRSNKVYGNQDFFSKITSNKFLEEFIIKKRDTDFDYYDFSSNLLRAGIPEEKIINLMKKYIEIGLITPCLGVKEDEVFLNSLKDAFSFYYKESSNLYTILSLLDNLSIKLDEFRDSNLKERYYVYNDIIKILTEYSEITGSEFDSSKNILYEDSYSKDVKKFEIDSDTKVKLSQLQKFYLLFDPNIRMILEISERLKYIKEPTIIDYKIISEFFEVSKLIIPYWGDFNYKSDICKNLNIRVLDEIKEQFILDVNNKLKDEKNEIDIEELVFSSTQKIPEEVLNNIEISTTFFLQKISEDGFVINSAYDGLLKFKSRFLKYFKKFINNDNRYREYINKVFEDNNYLEILDFFGFNGGVHSPVLKKACSLNLGTERFFDRNDLNQRIKFDDLKIYYDDNDKKLKFIDKSGEEVKFAYMSSLISLMLPGYVSFITGLYSVGRMTTSIADLFECDITPRVKFSNLIVSRKRWRMKSLDTIFSKEKIDDYDYYIKINDYFYENKIPKEFYLKYKKDYAKMDLKSDMTQFKPQYVNLENPLLVKLFRKIINENDTSNYYIEEAEPKNYNKVEEYSLELTSLYGGKYE